MIGTAICLPLILYYTSNVVGAFGPASPFINGRVLYPRAATLLLASTEHEMREEAADQQSELEYEIRPIWQGGDQDDVWKILRIAAHVDGVDTVKNYPQLAIYGQDFGARDGDVGFIAIEKSSNNTLGAAWVRRWQMEVKGYGFVKEDVPELAIGVFEEYKGKGIGTNLLLRLCEKLKQSTNPPPGISLSCQASNPALRLYERFGFKVVPGSELTNEDGDTSFNMIKQWQVAEEN